MKQLSQAGAKVNMRAAFCAPTRGVRGDWLALADMADYCLARPETGV